MKKVECPECDGTGYITYDEQDTLDCTLCGGYGFIFAYSVAEKFQLDDTVEKHLDEIRRVKNYIRQWQGLLSGELMIDKDNKIIESRKPQAGDSCYIRYYYGDK